MITNANQFANAGNPWSHPGDWDKELRDAGNPNCSTPRRRSAIAYTAKPEKSHNMRFPECPEKLIGHNRKEISETARILAIRNRLKADCEIVERRNTTPFVPHKPESQSQSQCAPPLKVQADRKAYYLMFEKGSAKTRAQLIFKNYSDIMFVFGRIPKELTR